MIASVIRAVGGDDLLSTFPEKNLYLSVLITITC
jgi:hypothetical protein